MKERERRLKRLRAVEREFDTAAVAIHALGERLKADPSALAEHGLDPQDFRTLKGNLEATYLIRSFAEFETGLRAAWLRAFRRKSHPPVTDLLNGVAARPSILQKWLEVSLLEIHEASDRLRRFFSQLPADW